MAPLVMILKNDGFFLGFQSGEANISVVQRCECGLLHVLGAVQVYLPRQWGKGCFEDPQKGAGFFLINITVGYVILILVIDQVSRPTDSLSSFIASINAAKDVIAESPVEYLECLGGRCLEGTSGHQMNDNTGLFAAKHWL